MQNLSRTALKELKKRYLNVLKKCLLANLGIILLSAPVMAEVVVNPINGLELLVDSTKSIMYTAENSVVISSDEIVAMYLGEAKTDEFGEIVYEPITQGGKLSFYSKVDFSGGKLVFFNNKSINTGGAIWVFGNGDVTFDNDVDFISNYSDRGGALASFSSSSKIDFRGNVLFKNNKAISGAAINNAGILKLKRSSFFSNYSTSANYYGNGGAIANMINASISFEDHTIFGSFGYLVDTDDIDNDGDVLEYVLDENGDPVSLGNGVIAKYDPNIETRGGLMRGGSIYNEGSIQFKSAEFLNNRVENTRSAGSSHGGAIYNAGGSVTFEDTDNNAETPVVPNITYGMTFKGNTLFTGNKAESDSGTARGGAIWNSGYMLLAGENTFGGYLQDTEDADGDGDKTEYVLDSEGNKISLGNEAKEGGAIYNTGGKKEGDVIAYGMTLGKSTFMSNTALSSGGAIYNTGYMNFTDEALFEGNEVESGVGSAISNKGFIYFTENTNFINNKSLSSFHANGAIYNDKNAIIKFNEHATFGGYKTDSNGEYVLDSEGNKISLGNTSTATSYSRGGAIYNDGDITFTSVDFINNRALEAQEVHGGAIYNGGTILFNGDVLFQDNYTAAQRESYGGAIENVSLGIVDDNGKIIKYGMTFNGSTRFLSNYVTSVGFSVLGGAIYNNGSMFFGNQTLFEKNSINITSGGANLKPSGGAVYNATKGVIDFGDKTTFEGNFVYANNENNTYGGAIYNKGILNFKDVDFIGNTGSSLVNNTYGQTYGAGIYNTGDSAQVTFTGAVVFKNNALVGTYKAQGGAIYNDSTKNTHGLIINGNAIFEGNKITTQMDNKGVFETKAQGGAIYNTGSLALKKDVLFKNNSVSGELAVSYGNVLAHGGAIYNSGTIDFDSGFTFRHSFFF